MNESTPKNVSGSSNSIIAIIFFFALLFVFSKWGPAINFNTSSQTKGEPFIVSGEGKVYVTPDIAKITIGIEENGTSLKTVQDSVSQKTSSLTTAIKKLGIKDEDIRTTSYNLSPQYDYETQPYKVNGYQISTTYQVKIRDFDKVNDVIVAATNAGANMEGNISFEVNDETENEKLNEARKLAVDEAKAKAEGLAKAAGINLGKIINISENRGVGPTRPLYSAGISLDSAKQEVEPIIQAGQTEIEVTISLSFEVR